MYAALRFSKSTVFVTFCFDWDVIVDFWLISAIFALQNAGDGVPFIVARYGLYFLG